MPTASAAVVQAARTQLAALAPPSAAQLDALLAITDELLARAAFEDAVGERRAAGGELRDVEIGPVPPWRRLEVPGGAAAGTAPAEIAAYLRGRGLDAVESRVLTGGFSKETILVTLRDGAEIVLRKVASGRTADTLADEYAVLEFATAHGLPVARPLWLDGALFATTRMPGRTCGDVTGPTADADAGAARQLGALLGRLHAVDPGEVRTPRPPMATTDDLASGIAEREKVVLHVADTLPGSPGLVLHHRLLEWLRAHLPDVDGPGVLVHGDIGFHNLLVSCGQVTALLDWEVAHRGRPAEDLAYVRPSVIGLLPWTEFVAEYRAAGGPDVDDAELRYFTVWQDVWRAVSCLRLRATFVTNPERLSDGVTGLLLHPRFLDSAVRNAA